VSRTECTITIKLSNPGATSAENEKTFELCAAIENEDLSPTVERLGNEVAAFVRKHTEE
jgi:hypothetical protein